MLPSTSRETVRDRDEMLTMRDVALAIRLAIYRPKHHPTGPNQPAGGTDVTW